MISVASAAMMLAALTSVALAVGAVVRRPRGILHWSFALGMTGFAVEAVTSWALTQALLADTRTSALQALEIARLLLVVPWVVFALALLRRGPDSRASGMRLADLWWVTPVIVATVSVVYSPPYRIPEIEAPVHAARLALTGRLSAVVQLAAMIGLLAALEAALRTSRGFARWRTKFLVLGVGGALLVRFYFLSQTLLFDVLMASYLVAIAATQVVANAVIFASLLRDRLTTELTVSRQIVYHSVALGALGVYLLAVGVIGWLLNRLGLSDVVVWTSLVIFVSAIALATVMLSEAVRWKIKRYVTTNFYPSKYDYRTQWMSFTKRLGSQLDLDALAPELLQTIVDTVGATTGILYLEDRNHTGYHLLSFAGFDEPVRILARDHAAIVAMRSATAPVVIDEHSGPGWHALHPDLRAGGVAIPMRRGEALIGVLVVGRQRGSAPYTEEDLEFLSTIAEQATVAISTVTLSETLAQSREFEAFHRLTSFVIHDLKNSISALSMLTENALRHFDDPEFQRDAIKTLSRTVERMTTLLGRLSSRPTSPAVQGSAVDLATLALDAAAPVLRSPRIALVKDLGPVRPVRGDADALLRVIQNILTNAIQSIDGEGTITLKTYERDGHACLAITDTGCGMSPEFVRNSLFAPFRTTKRGGWGIGLYQAKTVIDTHGGTLHVESTPGRGTTFEISVPAEPGKALVGGTTDRLDIEVNAVPR
jgi:putative PEP-CTERM system histidine kinase